MLQQQVYMVPFMQGRFVVDPYRFGDTETVDYYSFIPSYVLPKELGGCDDDEIITALGHFYTRTILELTYPPPPDASVRERVMNFARCNRDYFFSLHEWSTLHGRTRQIPFSYNMIAQLVFYTTMGCRNTATYLPSAYMNVPIMYSPRVSYHIKILQDHIAALEGGTRYYTFRFGGNPASKNMVVAVLDALNLLYTCKYTQPLDLFQADNAIYIVYSLRIPIMLYQRLLHMFDSVLKGAHPTLFSAISEINGTSIVGYYVRVMRECSLNPTLSCKRHHDPCMWRYQSIWWYSYYDLLNTQKVADFWTAARVRITHRLTKPATAPPTTLVWSYLPSQQRHQKRRRKYASSPPPECQCTTPYEGLMHRAHDYKLFVYEDREKDVTHDTYT